MRGIVIVRGGALGDFILGLPLLDSLRASHPGIRITLVAPRSWLPLAWRPDASVLLVALDDPAIGAMYAGTSPRLDSPALRESGSSRLPESGRALPGSSDPTRVLPAAHALVRKPDLALLLFGTVDPLFEVAWRALEPVHLAWYPSLPEPGRTLHAVDHLLGVLDVFDLGPGGGSAAGAWYTTALREPATRGAIPHIDLSAIEASSAEGWLDARGVDRDRPLVAIHPGSGGRWKCWPTERFARAASMLAERAAAQLLVVSGPADDEIVQAFRDSLGDTRVVEAASLPVRQLAAILARCSLFIGNDSGVTHLAAAVGCPTIALFGPTDDRVWGPRGRHVTIRRGVNAGASPPLPLPATWWRERPTEPDLSVATVLEVASSVGAWAPEAGTRSPRDDM